MLKNLAPPWRRINDVPDEMPASVMAALNAENAEPRLCAHVASSIVSDSSTCGRGAIAAAFAELEHDAVGDVLRKKC
jgi:hypothetical protein